MVAVHIVGSQSEKYAINMVSLLGTVGQNLRSPDSSSSTTSFSGSELVIILNLKSVPARAVTKTNSNQFE